MLLLGSGLIADVLIAQAVNWDILERLAALTKQNTPAPQWRPGPSKAEMRKQIEAAMARTAALPIKKLPPERRPKLGKRSRPKLGKRKRLIRG
jgi:hypothetical protein